MSKRNSAQHYAAVIIATYYSADFKQIPLFFYYKILDRNQQKRLFFFF